MDNEARAHSHQLLLDQLEEFRAKPEYGNNTCAVWVAPWGSAHCTDADTPLPECYRLVGVTDPTPRKADRDGASLDSSQRALSLITLHWLALLPMSQLPDEMLCSLYSRRNVILVNEWLDSRGRPLRFLHHCARFVEYDPGASFLDGQTSTVAYSADHAGATGTSITSRATRRPWDEVP